MPRIFVTGDTHGDIDLDKLSIDRFPQRDELTKEDLLLVCGDWGGIGWGEESDSRIQHWWNKQPYTCCWIDGNHEGFLTLEQLPIENWNGGKIHRISDNVIHLMRGQVFDIGGKLFYTMGGANSVDRQWRKPYVSWWPQEVPNAKEEREGFINLQAHNDCVNYILTHEGPASVVNHMYQIAGMGGLYPDQLAYTFDSLVGSVKFDHWFFAHHHLDLSFGRYTCCYQRIYELCKEQIQPVENQ